MNDFVSIVKCKSSEINTPYTDDMGNIPESNFLRWLSKALPQTSPIGITSRQDFKIHRVQVDSCWGCKTKSITLYLVRDAYPYHTISTGKLHLFGPLLSEFYKHDVDHFSPFDLEKAFTRVSSVQHTLAGRCDVHVLLGLFLGGNKSISCSS